MKFKCPKIPESTAADQEQQCREEGPPPWGEATGGCGAAAAAAAVAGDTMKLPLPSVVVPFIWTLSFLVGQ